MNYPPGLMFVAGDKNSFSVFVINSRKAWPFLLLSFILISCNKKNADSGDYSEAFKPIFNKASRFLEFNQPTQGIHYLDSAFSHIDKPTINDKFRFYSFHYVYSQKVNKDPKQAFLYADSMLMEARKSVTKQQYVANFAEGNYAKGDVYFGLNQYNDAYQCYFQGYLLAKSNLHNVSLADYTYRIGMIMYKKSHYKLAANYFKESYHQSISIKDDFPEFYRKQELLNNIAISFKDNGDIDSALIYFDKCLNYINDNALKFKSRSNMLEIARGVNYENKAEVLIKKGLYDPANELLKKSVAINIKKGGDNYDAELAEINLGQLFLITHKNDSLIKLLGNLRNQLDSVKNDEAEINWNKLMGSYYLQKNNLKSALYYIQNYNSLKDSTIKKLSSLKESDVNQQLNNFEKEQEIENLSNNNKIQHIYLQLAIICAVMAVAIIFLVWRNWRRSKFDVVTVKLLNEQINQQKTNLEKALEELKNSSREKDRILRTVAHDLRNPLGGIASLTNIMVDESDDNDLKEQLRIIKDTSSDTLELINEILEATNNSASKELSKQLIEINSLLNNSVELLRFKAAEKHQLIIIDGLETPEQLYINREKIWRVISNLITNAIKFSPVGEAIRIKVIHQKDHIQISIADHGIGIPPEMKDKVFNMFTDAKRPGTIGEKSFGLGLSICKQIIENHNGKIWFESQSWKGTTFYVSLPRPAKADILASRPEAETKTQAINN
ncbi:MAG: tetratricopeptide repeat protein [Mucilaginibacter sp.]|nr:tetratricopeptide repeat protein [Mucilaginibacter sp.]